MKNIRQSASGFTIIELMVVVVILGILGTIALPSFKTLIENQRAKNASFDLYSSLNLARSEAIKRNSNVTLTVTNTGIDQVNWIVSAGSETISTQGSVKGVALTPSGTTIVTFGRNGRLTSTTVPAFLISVTSDPASNSRCVTVELSGMPKTVKKATCP